MVTPLGWRWPRRWRWPATPSACLPRPAAAARRDCLAAAGKAFGDAGTPRLQLEHEGQLYPRGRASYEFAGCRCLTSLPHRWRPESAVGAWRGSARGHASGPFLVPGNQKGTHAMDVTETTHTFLDFFRSRGHQVVQGSSLVAPDGDPVLFTTSGMHPLT